MRDVVAGGLHPLDDVVDALLVARACQKRGCRRWRRRWPGTPPGARGRPRRSRTRAASGGCCWHVRHTPMGRLWAPWALTRVNASSVAAAATGTIFRLHYPSDVSNRSMSAQLAVLPLLAPSTPLNLAGHDRRIGIVYTTGASTWNGSSTGALRPSCVIWSRSHRRRSTRTSHHRGGAGPRPDPDNADNCSDEIRPEPWPAVPRRAEADVEHPVVVVTGIAREVPCSASGASTVDVASFLDLVDDGSPGCPYLCIPSSRPSAGVIMMP